MTEAFLKHNGSHTQATYTFLVGKPVGKSPRDKPRSRWSDNVRTV